MWIYMVTHFKITSDEGFGSMLAPSAMARDILVTLAENLYQGEHR